MGWWIQDEEGHSFSGDTGMLWGDGPADILDAALDKIVKEFQEKWGRPATQKELEAGFKFSLGGGRYS